MQITVQRVFGSRSFWAVGGLLLAANLWSWLRHRLAPICCDQEMTIGFPVPFHISGGVTGASNFYPLGLLLDIAIIVTVALIAAWIGAYVSSRPQR